MYFDDTGIIAFTLDGEFINFNKNERKEEVIMPNDLFFFVLLLLTLRAAIHNAIKIIGTIAQ
jgi:hypothetical protein